MVSGSSGELTRGAGPPHGCHAALRPRGRAVSGPRGAQEAHNARPRGKGPRDHAGPRGRPCGAPNGRLAHGGPTGIEEPW